MLFTNVPQTIVVAHEPPSRILAIGKGAVVSIARSVAVTGRDMALEIARSIEAFGVAIGDATGEVPVVGFEMLAGGPCQLATYESKGRVDVELEAEVRYGTYILVFVVLRKVFGALGAAEGEKGSCFF